MFFEVHAQSYESGLPDQKIKMVKFGYNQSQKEKIPKKKIIKAQFREIFFMINLSLM
jgi:hypothetical protein